jgi:hypothetical protein
VRIAILYDNNYTLSTRTTETKVIMFEKNELKPTFDGWSSLRPLASMTNKLRRYGLPVGVL